MRIIAFMNQKGGVGKTTTTVNLGAALAEAGKRICLIDMDPQAHLTINYGVEPSAEMVSLYNVLVDERPLREALQLVDEKISLVPSSIDLAAAEIELVSVLGREQILKKRIEAAELDCDYILLDCPPSLGLLTINALAMASEVIIPMQPHFLALQGVGKLLETVHLVSRRMNPGLKVTGIVLTMFDSQTRLSAEVVNDLNSFIEAAKGKPLPWAGARIFKSKIRRNIKLAESPSFGETILRYDPASNGAVDYRNLAKELLAMEGTPAPAARVVETGVGKTDQPEPARRVEIPGRDAAPAEGEAVGGAMTGDPSLQEQAPAGPKPAPVFGDAPIEAPATENGGEIADAPAGAPEASASAPAETPPAQVDAPVAPATPATPPVSQPSAKAPRLAKPRAAKPRVAVLVTPEEAARLKAANVPEVVDKGS